MNIQKKKTLAIAFAVILLTIGSLMWFREALLVELGRWLVVQTPLRQVDLVVALGGDRVRQDEAVRLLKQGMTRLVLFAGADVRPRDYDCLGVTPVQAVPPTGPAYTTTEEALAIRNVVESRGMHSVLIVTSPYHLRRARLTFERAFQDSDVSLSFSPAPSQAFSMDSWWQTHIGRKLVLTEYVGLFYYWLTI